MNKVNVIANVFSRWSHISIILTGLAMLKEKDIINLEINDCIGNINFPSENEAGIELIIENKKVYIDVADGYNNLQFIEKNINKYAYYFKRSYSEKINKRYNLSKIIPLGLNYEVYHKDISINFSKAYKQKIKKIILNSIGKKNTDQLYIDDFINKENTINSIPEICFTARLWDLPGEDVEIINNNRIQIVKELKDKYDSNFFGGVYDSKLSRKLCPDLIVNKFYTYKYNYINRMKKCDICIATTGLHNSVGWKFAEYVVASKAIVSEKLNYYVPGGFEENKNYLSFDTVEECLNKVEFLMKNKNQIKKISDNNKEYFNRYLSPESQVKRVIDIVLS